ncbi:MAG: hypothetical protein VYE40_17190 [Myxococcota bacterium]|nr:hypothetical protein [Myxococcota bacterium]
MSDDGTFIFRRDGEERFFYVRRGGSYIDRVMLRGEAGFLEHLDDTREWPYPFLETWLAGLLVVDFDARELMFYSTQFPASSVMEMRLLTEITARAWPGYTIIPWHDPAYQLSRWLPEHPPTRALERAHREWTLDAFREMQELAWEEALQETDWASEIAECGESVVRGWFEYHTHKSVAFLLDGDGGCQEVTFADEWDTSALLSTGEEALEVLRARHPVRIEALLDDSEIESAYWIDPGARAIHYWTERPRWSAHPLRFVSERWPGWSFHYEPGGALSMIERLGREPRGLLGENIQEYLRKMLARIYTPPPPGEVSLANVVTRLRDERDDGEAVEAISSSPEHVAPKEDLIGWFWRVADEILARPEFQPLSPEEFEAIVSEQE